MTAKEAQKVLDELHGVRPEVLNGEAKRLFEAIMKIADIKDKLFKENKKLREELEKCQKKYGKILKDMKVYIK